MNLSSLGDADATLHPEHLEEADNAGELIGAQVHGARVHVVQDEAHVGGDHLRHRCI